jgi:hypothetical protein
MASVALQGKFLCGGGRIPAEYHHRTVVDESPSEDQSEPRRGNI